MGFLSLYILLIFYLLPFPFNSLNLSVFPFTYRLPYATFTSLLSYDIHLCNHFSILIFIPTISLCVFFSVYVSLFICLSVFVLISYSFVGFCSSLLTLKLEYLELNTQISSLTPRVTPTSLMTFSTHLSSKAHLTAN